MFVCCVLSGRGLCDELITLTEESYPTVARCMLSRNLVDEEAIARDGLQCLDNNNNNNNNNNTKRKGKISSN
jgi:hypothetical protein